MSTFLFPAGKHSKASSKACHKAKALPRNLFHIVRAASDAADALRLFLKLVSETNYDAESPGFLAFDAHVGDTSCQLRACMLLELVNRFKRIDSSTADLHQLNIIAKRLEEVVKNARILTATLCAFDMSKCRLEDLGLSKVGTSMEELLQKVGWFGISLQTPLSPSPRSSEFPSEDESSYHKHDQEDNGAPTPPLSVLGMQSLDSSEKCNLTLSTFATSSSEHWMPWNLDQVVHFIVYCYILSKYKKFVVVASIYGARIEPDLAFQNSHRLIHMTIPACFHPAAKRPIQREFEELQGYISELSCAWLTQKSKMFYPDRQIMSSLLEKSTRTSARGVTSVATYLGYLVLRELWAQTSTPIILVSKRFCSSGFHVNVFLVTLCVSDHSYDENLESVIRPNISWRLSHVTGKQLENLRGSSHPHITIFGNSIDGDTCDYLDRLPHARLHKERCCADNRQHCATILEADQDRIALSLFADHRHYAFSLDGEEARLGEEEVVQQIMNDIDPGLSRRWLMSKKESRILGTGPSLRTIMWQHIVLERPGTLLRLLDKMDRPMILHPPVFDSAAFVMRVKSHAYTMERLYTPSIEGLRYTAQSLYKCGCWVNSFSRKVGYLLAQVLGYLPQAPMCSA